MHRTAPDNHRPNPPARGGRLAAPVATLAGSALMLVTVVASVTLVTSGASPGNAVALGPPLAKKHHSDDSDDSGGDSQSSQSQTSDGSTQTNRGCSKVIHSLDELNGALASQGGGRNGSVCVQMNNQSVNNTGGWTTGD